ncbi:methyltransferase [Rhizobium sp. FKY42]|uniref:methyltransferase n=1 Tax=Rhizobium sp. FKY42 TaxID=2562310 RepID=UPI001484DAF8|nr:methyltransferase [Rhizobium sp. FKY42]
MLGNLVEALADRGLGEFLTSFNPLHPRPLDWRPYRDRVPDRLRILVELFAFGAEIDVRQLPQELGWISTELPRAGVAIFDGRKLQLKVGLRLLPVAGRWLFCTPPGTGLSHYLGDDSVALMLRIQPRAEATVLDLCSGSGLQALHCAGFARRITAVERNRDAVELAQVNVMLNRLEGKIDVLQGDMFEPVEGRQFDLVVANPPLLPVPDSLPDLSIGHGGYDGMRACCRILEGLPAALSPSGRGHLIASCLADADNHYLRDLLVTNAKAHHLDIVVTVVSMKEVAAKDGYLEAMASAVAREIGQDPNLVLAAYREDMRQRKATHLSFLFLMARHGSGRVELLDMRTADDQGVWHIV